jgi:hypothetical protein
MQPVRIYTIRIQGHLSTHWSDWFEGMKIVHLPTGHTCLEGHIADQAALFGLLNKLRDLGLALLAIDSTEVTLAATYRKADATTSSRV